VSEAELRLLRDNAARFAEQSAGFGLLGRRLFDEAERAQWLRALAAGSWTGLRADEEIGGMGLSCLDLATVLEQFGRKLLPISAPLLASAGLLHAGVPDADAMLEGRAMVLPALQSKGLRPSPGHGSKLEEAGGGLRLTGSKAVGQGAPQSQPAAADLQAQGTTFGRQQAVVVAHRSRQGRFDGGGQEWHRGQGRTVSAAQPAGQGAGWNWQAEGAWRYARPLALKMSAWPGSACCC
jgi:hypothetical protein